MAEKELLLTKKEGIATITFNRPEKLNALTEALRAEVYRITTELRYDDEVKVLVITGAGEAFSTGADVAEIADSKPAETPVKIPKRPLGWWILPVRYLPKPTIAAIPGIVAGVSFSLALACDIRIASEKARFSMAFVRRALIPDGGATYYLPRIVGPSKSLELMFSGEIIAAAEAERLGLVNRVVPHDELMKATMELATGIAKGPSVAIELTKRAVYKGVTNDLESQLDFETYAQSICAQTEDFGEGVRAFLDKRQPHFEGR